MALIVNHELIESLEKLAARLAATTEHHGYAHMVIEAAEELRDLGIIQASSFKKSETNALAEEIAQEGVERVVYGKGIVEMKHINRLLVEALRSAQSAEAVASEYDYQQGDTEKDADYANRIVRRCDHLESELATANENRRLQADAIRDYESELAQLRHDLEKALANHTADLNSAPSSTERAIPHRVAPVCDEHGDKGGGARSGCPYCVLLKLYAALSKIDYLCGEPNDMEVSGFDVHCDEDAVVEHVKQRLSVAPSATGGKSE